MFYSIGCGNDAHQCKQVTDGFGHFLIFCCGTCIRYCTHNFLAYCFGLVDQVNPVSGSFSHFAGPVKPGNLQQLFPKIKRFRQGKIFHSIHTVEALGKLSGHLQVLFLVLSHGDLI